MDRMHYEEMVENLDELIQEHVMEGKDIYLFGHCNATEELADLLLSRGFPIAAILDNNAAKHGKQYRNIVIEPPQVILESKSEETLVCIVARAYAAMVSQLKRLGYTGSVRKLVDYNSYAEYSLSEETLIRRKQRVERGIRLLDGFGERYPGRFRILCPFSALGDIYFTMSYLPYFLEKRGISACVIGVIGNACRDVVRLFGEYEAEAVTQKDMDEMIQAALYTRDETVFLPHQDRPYVVNLSRALYVKRIPLEQIYCCGVYGLPAFTKPVKPVRLKQYGRLQEIEKGRAVILSPYAKSVTALNEDIWEQIVRKCREKGVPCYTNVAGEEKALPGTLPVSPAINEIQSVVEHAGLFIGIRSGLCDVIREAGCRKIALYPDYHYCDTEWKAVEMYSLAGWENIVVGEGFQWNIN